DLVPGLPPPVPGEADTERYRLFEAVASLFASVSSQRSVALVLEDLHWADRPTMLLLRHLARHSERLPLLLIGTCRSAEGGQMDALGETVADLRRDDLVTELPLGGL